MGSISEECENRKTVEVCDTGKIIRLQNIHRLQATAFRHHVEGRVSKKSTKLIANGVLVQFFQEGTLDLIAQSIHRIVQVFLCCLFCQFHQHLRQRWFAWKINVIDFCQMIDDAIFIILVDSPKPRVAPAHHKMGVRDIEHIAQPLPGTGIVDQRNSLCTTVYPSRQLAVPNFQLRTGRRLRPLGMDQHTIRKVIAIEPCGGIQVACPVPWGTTDFSRMDFCQSANVIEFCHVYLQLIVIIPWDSHRRSHGICV